MQKPIGVHRVGRVSYPPCRVFYPAHPTQDGPHFGRHAQPMADVPGRIPGTAGETPALPKTRRPALSPVVCGRWYQLNRLRRQVEIRVNVRHPAEIPHHLRPFDLPRVPDLVVADVECAAVAGDEEPL